MSRKGLWTERRSWSLSREQADKLAKVDVAVSKEYCVVGPVEPLCEPQRISRGKAPDIVGRSKDAVSERMTGKQQVLELIVDKLRRRVVVAFYLVAYNLHLLVNLALRICASEDNIGKKVYGTGEMLVRNGGIEDRVLLVCESIEIATEFLKTVDDGESVAVGSPLEGDMLAEMSQALLAILLVACASLNLETAINNLRGVGQMYYAQSVGQLRCVIFHVSVNVLSYLYQLIIIHGLISRAEPSVVLFLVIKILIGISY